MLRVATSTIKYRGPDRLDITRGSGGAEGHPFAPSWRTLGLVLAAREEARRVLANAKPACIDAIQVGRPELVGVIEHNAHERAVAIQRYAWSDYVPAYLEEMADSQRLHPGAWQALLARPRVILVCYCRERERCHRGLLARLLVERGAVDEGELGEQLGLGL